MVEGNVTLTTFYALWKEYQDRLAAALAPLTTEQLALRAAPGLRSIGELTEHIIGCRVGWFTDVLGEQASADISVMCWEELDAPARSASEFVQGLTLTGQWMTECLTRWSPADMAQTFAHDREGEQVHLSRAWIVGHVHEHDLHHGGELSLTLGLHGLEGDFTS